MQKITFKNSRNQNLVGVLHPGPFPTPIIMLHGFGGTKEEHGRFEEVAKSINRSGFPVFRFDFAGCGESDSQDLSHKSEVEDLNSAIKFLRTQGYKEFGVVGHSMGGLISLKANNEFVKVLVLWSSPTQPMNHFLSEKYPEEVVAKLVSEGKLTIPTPKNKFQKSFTISKKMIEESKNINQEKLFSDIDYPILLIHGDEDRIVPIQQSIDAIQFVSEESELVTLKGAYHNCFTHLKEISELASTFFNTYLKTLNN